MPGLESQLLATRKNFAPEMLKIQPDFREIRGKMGKNVDIADILGQDGISCKNYHETF